MADAPCIVVLGGMTVGELIAFLQSCKPSRKVKVWDTMLEELRPLVIAENRRSREAIIIEPSEDDEEDD